MLDYVYHEKKVIRNFENHYRLTHLHILGQRLHSSVDHQNGITKSFQNHIKNMTKELSKERRYYARNGRGYTSPVCTKSATNQTADYLG